MRHVQRLVNKKSFKVKIPRCCVKIPKTSTYTENERKTGQNGQHCITISEDIYENLIISLEIMAVCSILN